MSNRYKGGVISATPPTTTGGEDGTASGAWTLEQQMQLQAAGLWPAQPTGPWIEDCFSTYLYTGTGAAQTITNGINLSGKGGLVWIKSRVYAQSHGLFDTVRGVEKSISSNSTSAQLTQTRSLTAFGTSGFSLGTDDIYGNVNFSGVPYASWTFREQPKFFDIVTWTGNGVGGRQIAHNLGVVPGCLMVKVLSEAGGWSVWHRAIPGDTNQTGYLSLNSTQEAELNKTNVWAANGITSTYFTASTDSPSNINGNGQTYVAYLFAHNAGGFGLTGTDNVISCGGFTHAGANAVQTLGYEPQFLLIKKVNDVGDWKIVDTMRGWSVAGPDLNLYPNTSGAEVDSGMYNPVATGFDWGQNGTFIYIAIRRGPMRTPTVGTSVFTPTLATFSGTTVTNTGYVVDMAITKSGVETTSNNFVIDRLRGSDNGANQNTLPSTSSTSAEVVTSGRVAFTGSVTIQNGFLQQNTTANNIVWAFGRAPSFFDEVCYTGNSTASTPISHNLGVIPELIIVKSRSAARNWPVYIGSQGNNGNSYLNLSNAWASGSDMFANTTPTASEFYVGNNALTNNTAETYVAFLFATCAGVSKVGSYTGTGAAQTINCGFTAGSRFVLIKRTDSTGGWHVWDSARGIIPSNDPYLLLNSTTAEVTGTDYIDTTNVGFDITSAAPDAINASGGTFIFLAIA